jgi:REP element-mobilizing transposase RayT
MEYPIAYHITFTTYGTWLHGDRRGSVDEQHNQYRSAFVSPDAELHKKEQNNLKNPPVILDKNIREVVLKAVLQVCSFRNWAPYAVHVRSNHIHIVVSGNAKPEKMMIDFKAYATRAIKGSDDNQKFIGKYWSLHGSTKYIWTKENLASAIDYVKNRQGKIMSLWVGDLSRALSVSAGYTPH